MKDSGKAFSLMTQIAVSMLVPIFICLFIGKWIDNAVGTSPLFMIIFIIIGVGAGFRSIWILTQSFYKGKDTYISTGKYLSPEEYDNKYKDDNSKDGE